MTATTNLPNVGSIVLTHQNSQGALFARWVYQSEASSKVQSGTGDVIAQTLDNKNSKPVNDFVGRYQFRFNLTPTQSEKGNHWLDFQISEVSDQYQLKWFEAGRLVKQGIGQLVGEQLVAGWVDVESD